MLHEVSGDILLTRSQAIAHGVGPHDNFGQGLALSLRERWPAMYRDFKHYCRVHNPQPGSLWAWMGADGTRIVNLFTQDAPQARGGHPGRASLQNLGRCLKALHSWIEREDLESIALPRLATGVGGLDWELVRPELNRHLGHLGMTVIVYTEFHAGQAAAEPL